MGTIHFNFVRCQSDVDSEVAEVVEGGDLGIVGDDVQDFGDVASTPAPGVDTICVFPRNTGRLVPAGEETTVLVGVKNEDDSERERLGHPIVIIIRLPDVAHQCLESLQLVADFAIPDLSTAVRVVAVQWQCNSLNILDVLMAVKWRQGRWVSKLLPMGCIDFTVSVEERRESPLNVIAIKASVHLPFDHQLLVQNLTVQEFTNASLPVSVQATYPYAFVVNKFLQPGAFDLVGTILYEVDQQLHQSVFYNGTIEVVEAGGFLSMESVFLITLGIALLGLLGLWVHGQIQNLSKKTKRAPKVEVGTGTKDASVDEWLQGTAYAQSLSSNKSKKKQK
ncbi:hypothetical protein ACLOJK_027980 [Asimina triloba]